MVRVDKVKMIFYSSKGWELNGLERVNLGDGVDSMFRFHLKRRGDGMKRYRKMNRRQRTRLDSIERKEA
jgi:hypothetical protein